MNLKRTLEQAALKLRGVDLNELEEEWRQLDAAKAERERERTEAERQARHRINEIGTRVTGRRQ